MKFERSHQAVSGVVALLLAMLLSSCAGESNGGADPDGAADANQEIRDAFPKDILDRGTLRVAVSGPTPPHVTLTGDKLGGTDIDFFDAIGELAGLDVEYQNVKFDALIPSIQAKKTDVTGTLLPSPDRRSVADFALYLKVPFGLLLPKGNPENIEGVSDLCGLTVALVQGSTPPQAIVDDRQKGCEAAGEPKIKTRLYSDNNSPILAVKSGDADAFVQSEALTAYIAKTADDGKSFIAVPDREGLGGTVYFTDGFGVLKENQELLKAIQKSLQFLVDNGDYLEILEKYGIPQDAIKKITINELAPEDQE